jgi:hypothetical protein
MDEKERLIPKSDSYYFGDLRLVTRHSPWFVPSIMDADITKKSPVVVAR